MKGLFTLALGLILSLSVSAQMIKGTVIDSDYGDPLIGASVVIKGSTVGTITDIDGNFSLNKPADAGNILEISYLGYDTYEIAIGNDSSSDLGKITLNSSGVGLEDVVISGVMDIVRDRKTPVAVSTISLREIQAKGVGNVEFPEVMKNTPSVYVSNQTGFGDSQMFLRGFSQTNTAFLLNGQPINGMEDGRMYWSNWSGMSDVASAVQIQRGLGSSKLAISSVGGTINIVTKTTDESPSGFARLMYGNDNYMKGTLAYNTGLKGKWSFNFLLDHWQADNKWADGTRGQGQNYFMSVGFKPNEKHNFNFLITGAPQWHGNRWSQSLDQLEENPKFNQHWGENEGEWDTERRNFYHKPVINLNWDFEINEKSKLASVLYASFGRGGGTGPFGSSSNRVRTEAGQVAFDSIRINNIADDDGIGSFGGNYALRASMNNHQWYGNVTSYEIDLNENLNWSVGADFRLYTGDHFRQFADLLGLDGWSDNFRHATRPDDAVQSEVFDANPWSALFSFASEDQRIAYDYSEQINYQGAFSQLEYAQENFTTFVQGSVSNQSYQRTGRWSDIGTSEKVSKIGYNLKGGVSYTADENSVIFANAGIYSRQPFLDNIFENVRYSNELVTAGGGNTVDNEDIIGLEVGYRFENDYIRFNANAYKTDWGNRTRVAVFTNDNGTPANEDDDFTQRNVERGIKQSHKGIELDIQYKIEKLSVKAYSSIGDWTFAGIDRIQGFNDDTGEEVLNESGLDNTGVHIPNAPQTSIGFGLDYRWDNGLSLFADYNIFERLYINNINFDDSNLILTEDIGTLDPFALLDMGVSYNLTVGDRLMSIRANIYNVLNTDYINQTDPFGYLNGNGRTWNTSLKYNF